MSHVAVIDIGKTNAKLALVDLDTLTERAVMTRPNTVIPRPPWPHFDVDGHWSFLLNGLARFHATHRVDAISITTHGAAIALIGHDGLLAAPILDYEHTGPELLDEAYTAIRPFFAETGTPRLAGGLNIGAQLFWQFETDRGLKARTHHIVTYPQYWGYRLTGVAATDVTSLGCHTDLWNPFKGQPSSLVARLGIEGQLASTRNPDAVLGSLAPDIAQQTGLPLDTPVYCGIHDSNASLLAHLVARSPPFSVVSTGTWVICMAIGGRAITLDPTKDTLVNVNAFGDPVPSARFMGGREHDLLVQGHSVEPNDTDVATALNDGPMLQPAAVSDTGPFQGMSARWIGTEPPPGTGLRTACVSFYLALVTSRCLTLIGHMGPVFVEGPFARNASYLKMLASATGTTVHAMTSATGTSEGAALLARMATGRTGTPQTEPVVSSSDDHAAYAGRWSDLVDQQ
ncbi:carbohydrate kinase [Tateyamaria omphalii]|uniref:FGGY-family carbohydrate kinase n=1 Tax=Tateyamaria omphalii TaxID=299262 RepID=UPI001671C43C|nr:FGGY-family carbohydrate kinase [Tateyamaria omphalii]GGX50915.1 carbohydrate kinase [Tateyamaria omphalii]